MEIGAATKMVYEAMERFGLSRAGWTFRWDNAKQRFGLCSHYRKLILMSRALTLANDEEEVRDTLLHEIAHALVDAGHGHDHVWKLKAIEVGARPERCYDGQKVKRAASRYTGKCLSCGLAFPRYRRPSMSLLISGKHVPCQRKEGKGKIEWRDNGELMTRQLPAPLWMREQAARMPNGEVKQDLSQSDINAMWERLNKLEGK